jgi:hypothetical protein
MDDSYVRDDARGWMMLRDGGGDEEIGAGARWIRGSVTSNRVKLSRCPLFFKKSVNQLENIGINSTRVGMVPIPRILVLLNTFV